jgi:hypothetical protein
MNSNRSSLDAQISASYPSLVPLPDDLPRQLTPQTDLDKLALMVPGVLSPSLGRWVVSRALAAAIGHHGSPK